ncbi:MAG: phage head closure protein [Bauldia sp.]|nr:phage head closure protein [Bauldia sp.]
MRRLSFDPGWLRHRIVIEAPIASPDGAGGETVTWDMLASVWALVEPVGAGETVRAGRLTGTVTHAVTIRFRSDVAGGMRVAYRGRHYRVLAVYDPDERRRYLTLKTELETP